MRALRRTYQCGWLFTVLGFSSVVRADSTIDLPFFPHKDIAIKVDGHLHEAVWETIPAQDDMRVINPDTLVPASKPTRLRIFNTERGLYIAAEMVQDPDTLFQRLSGRDSRVNRDSINVTLDTSGEGRYGFWFGVGLGDSLSDGTVLPERKFANEWDGPWRGASQITDQGWTAELYIPWSTVSMPRASDRRNMGIYVSRKVAYLDERWGWPALPDTQPRFLSDLAPIAMQNVQPRQQYNLYPFVSTTRDEIDNKTRYKAGADVFWRPSSNLQLNATINPDFGGVESDNVIINLTATETFFPEKRLFFQEGQDLFNATARADTRSRGVGNSGTPYTLLNTRRIGGRARSPTLPSGATLPLREALQPVDLYGALKLTGQTGRWRYGFLGASEKDKTFEALDATNLPLDIEQSGSDYGVIRLLYEDSDTGPYRSIGLLSTAAAHTEQDAYTHGVDVRYRTAGGVLDIDGQVMMSDVDGQDTGYGGFLDFEYIPVQGRRLRVGLEHLDEHLDINDLGFLARNDWTRVRSAYTRTQSDLGWASSNEFDVRGFLGRNHEGDFVGGGVFFSDRLWTNDRAAWTFRLGHQLPAIDDLNSFGNGSYRIEERTQVSINYQSPSAQAVFWSAGVEVSEENLGGDSLNLLASAVWRPFGRFNMRVDLGYSRRHGWLLHQEERNFTTFDATQWQVKYRLEYFLNARHQLSANLQWVGIRADEDRFFLIPNRVSDLIPTSKPPGPSDDFSLSDLVLQIRYRWELAPLSDLFVVYTRGANQTITSAAQPTDPTGFDDLFDAAWQEPLLNQLVVKLRYRFGS